MSKQSKFRSEIESLEESQEFPIFKPESEPSEPKEIKRRVSWGNYRVREYLQNPEEDITPEGGAYPLIESEDIIQAPLGSPSPDPHLCQIIEDSNKQDIELSRQKRPSPSDMDISEVTSPTESHYSKVGRTGRELIAEFNKLSTPVYMNIEEHTPGSQRVQMPEPGVPQRMLKQEGTPLQEGMQDPPMFNMLSPVKEEDPFSMELCDSETSEDYSLQASKENTPLPVTPIPSKGILKKAEEDRRSSIQSSKLDRNKLTPLKTIPCRTGRLSMSNKKLVKSDSSKNHKRQVFREEIQKGKERILTLKTQKQKEEQRAKELNSREQEHCKSLDCLLETEEKKLQNAQQLFHKAYIEANSDLVALKENERWMQTFHQFQVQGETKVFQHKGSFLYSDIYSKLYAKLSGEASSYSLEVFLDGPVKDPVFDWLWPSFAGFLEFYLSSNKESYILEKLAELWNSFIQLTESIQTLSMAFEVTEMTAQSHIVTIQGRAGCTPWNISVPYTNLNAQYNVFLGVCELLNVKLT